MDSDERSDGSAQNRPWTPYRTRACLERQNRHGPGDRDGAECFARKLFRLVCEDEEFLVARVRAEFRGSQLDVRRTGQSTSGRLGPVGGARSKIGGSTIHSVEPVLRLARPPGDDAEVLSPLNVLSDLRLDNGRLSRGRPHLHGSAIPASVSPPSSVSPYGLKSSTRSSGYFFKVQRLVQERLDEGMLCFCTFSQLEVVVSGQLLSSPASLEGGERGLLANGPLQNSRTGRMPNGCARNRAAGRVR